MVKRNTTISIPYGEYYVCITLEYSNRKRLKWLINELTKIFELNESKCIDDLSMPINQLLSTVNDLNVIRMKLKQRVVKLKNNVFELSYYDSDNYDYIDCDEMHYFYDMKEDNKIDTSHHISIELKGNIDRGNRNYMENRIYRMFFTYKNVKKCILEKNILFGTEKSFRASYKFFDDEVYIKFGEFIKIDGKEIKIENNYYIFCRNISKSIFFDFESNDCIRKLLSKKMWILRYTITTPVLKELIDKEQLK